MLLAFLNKHSRAGLRGEVVQTVTESSIFMLYGNIEGWFSAWVLELNFGTAQKYGGGVSVGSC